MYASNRNETWIAVSLLLLLTTVLFFRTYGFDWLQYDDPKHIFENARILSPTIPGVWSFWTDPYFGLYVPVTYTAWAIVAGIAGKNVGASHFHLFNLLLHLANATLVFFMLSRWLTVSASSLSQRLRTGSAALGALAFATHPLQVESVAWISCGKDLLSAFFGLSALYLRPSDTSRHQFHSTGLFLLSILAKPSGVIFALLGPLLEYHRERVSWRILLSRYQAWFAAAATVTLFTRYLQPEAKLKFITPLWSRPFIAGDSLLFYLRKLAWPSTLSVDYARTSDVVLAQSFFWMPLLIVIGIALALWKLQRRYSWVSMPAAWFAISLLPVLGLISFSFQINSNVADRYTYVALIGFAILVSELAARSPSHPVRALVALPLIGYALLSNLHLVYWRSSEPLFLNALASAPNSQVCHINLGYELLTKKNYVGAAEHFHKSVQTEPKNADLWINLGAALSWLRKFDEAENAFQTALTLDPKNAMGYYNYGLLARMRGDMSKARDKLSHAALLQPNVPAIQRALAELPK